MLSKKRGIERALNQKLTEFLNFYHSCWFLKRCVLYALSTIHEPVREALIGTVPYDIHYHTFIIFMSERMQAVGHET